MKRNQLEIGKIYFTKYENCSGNAWWIKPTEIPEDSNKNIKALCISSIENGAMDIAVMSRDWGNPSNETIFREATEDEIQMFELCMKDGKWRDLTLATNIYQIFN